MTKGSLSTSWVRLLPKCLDGYGQDAGSDEFSYLRSSFTGNFRLQPTSIALDLGGAGVSIVSIATGDFNGDGKADILLQNANAQTMVWAMNGLVKLSSTVVGNPGVA